MAKRRPRRRKPARRPARQLRRIYKGARDLEARFRMILALGTFFTSTSAVVKGIDHWQDLLHPTVSLGLVGQLGSAIWVAFAERKRTS